MLTINNTLDGYLKDVEIKGNTIQDSENLADIRSVGDKVEGQELYEIPVVSCGKNLFDGEFREGKYETSDGSFVSQPKISANVNTILINENTNYSISRPTLADGINTRVIFYDKNMNYLSSELVVSNGSFISPSNAKYINFHIATSVFDGKLPFQLEEGTVATPYEPYVEDKLTILSPTPLEKVGDVADRIIEKDGVWGVEKNIITKVLDGNEGSWHFTDLGEYSRFSNYNACSDAYFRMHNALPVMSDAFVTGVSHNYESTQEQIMYYCHQDLKTELRVSILASKIDSTGFKGWLKDNNVTIKYRLAEPQFIPLPHDQQIKLRTFANKTNISFGCEIEGTIKAQVPKSLGATVNTHTEQISNLNKELDRVKKLEESTVSTVETESDFTTVEATSNGYFEDVKLEGKTLVNLFDSVKPNGSSCVTITDNDISITNPTGYIFCRMTTKQPLLIGKTYTFVVNCLENTHNDASIFIETANGAGHNSITSHVVKKGINIFTLTVKTEDTTLFRFVCNSANENSTIKISRNILLLEGDHTQNPPSYFEGLKSVGQSATTSEDGVDEISVESANNGNLANDVTYGGYYYNSPWGNGQNSITKAESSNARTSSKIKVFPNATYFYNAIGGNRCVINFFKNKSDNLPYNGVKINNSNIPTGTFNTDSECNYIEVYAGTGVEISNLFINLGDKQIDKEYQSDKKRLLYYNNETQAWEKPVLREWDSIEKHADGKYYYHQRSGEVVLNGSEKWSNFSTINGVGKAYTFDIKNKACGFDNLVCDKLPATHTFASEASILNGISGTPNNNALWVSINASITDIQGFKQWLQANNVTVVYQLAEEKVYECTNIDLITYANETNYIVECGAIAPKSTLKVHNNISNVVSLLQKKVSLLESDLTKYMITQNRLMLASRYNADTVSFKVDVASLRDTFEYDNDLYELILNNILVGKDNYNRDYIENLIIFYWMDFVISDEMYLTLFEIIEEQHNPKVIEEEAPIEE